MIELRRTRGKYYDDNLKKIKEIEILLENKDSRTVYQLYSVIINSPEERPELQNFLLESDIYTKIYFPPIHLKTYYRKKYGYREGDLPKTEEISSRILTLPFSINFSDEDQNYIINKIKEFFRN